MVNRLPRLVSLMVLALVLVVAGTVAAHAVVTGAMLPAPAAGVPTSPDMSVVTSMMLAAGLGKWVPWITGIVTVAAALDSVLPQPQPGSHWLPLRMVLSAAAFNWRYAANGGQPSIQTWVMRVLRPLIVAEAAQMAAQAAGAPAPIAAPAAALAPQPPAPPAVQAS